MSAAERAVDELIGLLVSFGPGDERVANPWVDEVPGLDRPGAARARRRNLREYLLAHLGAELLLVGQEAGYAGCRFSGIPFTGEDLLAGPKAIGILARPGLEPTSAFERPMSERSANVVWPVIGSDGRCALWNSFPFHCHEPGEPLTNRAWSARDDRRGLAEAILRHALERVLPQARLVAVGRKAEAALAGIGRRCLAVRHPSQGGATLFRAQMRDLLRPPFPCAAAPTSPSASRPRARGT
jgi:hypothetical protein